MGEYARYKGEQIKIGTCESMYYLRADQAHLVTPQSGSVDPIKDRAEIRFRFPWPQEDGIEPGQFADFAKSLGLGVPPPREIDHRSVQFKHDSYLVNLSCPEQESGPESDHGMKFHRNGGADRSKISQQKWFQDPQGAWKLITIAKCSGCECLYRLETLEAAAPYLAELIRLAEGLEHTESVRPKFDASQGGNGPTVQSVAHAGAWHREVARRIEVGYSGCYPAPIVPAPRKSPKRALKVAQEPIEALIGYPGVE